MAKFMTDNGKTEEKMEVECGKGLMDNPILVNGKMVKWKDLVFM
jgi:hypothetical protein